MIEFKADCGHTVRAKDEDAGGVVRCSYCGRPANVPENKGDELDFLFNDIKAAGEQGAAARAAKPRGPGLFARRARRRGEFNPFAVVLRLCYAALLIIIVIVVGRKWVVPLFQGDGLTQRVVNSVKPDARTPRGGADKRPDAPPRPGLISRENLSGLYAVSTPPGGSIHWIEASRAPASGRIASAPGANFFARGSGFPNVNDGVYVVEVAFPWNDPHLTMYPQYRDFRRRLESATPEQRRHLVEEYFIPDEASVMFVEETQDQKYIIRQYRGVKVENRRTHGVRSLFLPRIPNDNGQGFSVEALVLNYLPKETAYSFDEQHVRNELRYYEVRSADEPFVVQALLRVGVIPYVTPDGRTRLFKIGIEDGMFGMSIVREARTDGRP